MRANSSLFHHSMLLAIVFGIGCSSSDATTAGDDPDSTVTDAAHDGVSLDEGPRDTSTGGDSTTADTNGTDGVATDSSSGDVVATETDDAGAMCAKGPGTSCGDPGLSCLCCAAGGPRENCTCSTKCTKNDDCKDPTRPKCNQQAAGIEGFCTSDAFVCCWLCK